MRASCPATVRFVAGLTIAADCLCDTEFRRRDTEAGP